MNFHDVKLPKFIEVFAIERPKFSTSKAITKSGRELRIADHNSIRKNYLIKDAHLSKLEFETFNQFFIERKGSNFAFRFKDLIVRFEGDNLDYTYGNDNAIIISEIELIEVIN